MISIGDEGDFDDWPVIHRYTAKDAVADGLFIPVGRVGKAPVYFTANLFFDGYKEEPDKVNGLVNRGLDMLREDDPEDTEYMRLRVVEKDRVWAILDGEGYKFMRPEDY